MSDTPQPAAPSAATGASPTTTTGTTTTNTTTIATTTTAMGSTATATATATRAQDAGSAAFCLFPLPADNGTQRAINLGIVQYVDVRADEVRIGYGGGNLGSGYEARIPIRSKDEGDAVLARLRRTAATCAKPYFGATP